MFRILKQLRRLLKLFGYLFMVNQFLMKNPIMLN